MKSGMHEGGSVYYETQLKSEILGAVNEKLGAVEKKMIKFIEDHSNQYKKDYSNYEEHFKDTVAKLNAYMGEMHDGHIKEIQKFKSEKDDQVIINNMFVKKI